MQGFRDFGSRIGTGGQLSQSVLNARLQREKKALMEEALQEEVAKDPYVSKNQFGQYECKLCMSVHSTIADYTVHRELRKHKVNIARFEKMKAGNTIDNGPLYVRPKPQRTVPSIGQPSYWVTRQRDLQNRPSIKVEVHYPEILDGIVPRWRAISWFEQKVEVPDSNWQFIAFAAQPYDTIAIKVPNWELDDSRTYEQWYPDKKMFVVQLQYADVPE
ncbi:putative splicing factor 3a subunit 2 [Carpediemonas membranifera]|uniref:Putative splicing factor 3a subunit 2 n=1 Tax=Carpediemonas membranifera TaxID=201153 RepID=A0A8J6E8K1_9EUKA|nr:putative splicing factor 3a subunit 2 [Carpediemonas membranifera]|eukprot:KAG9392020.1 putative splicing factor 3a subunit 2 [Carpediemonas membranifera]